MANRQTFHVYILLVFTLISEVVGIHAKENESRISVNEGAINSVVFDSGDARLVVYGVEKEIDMEGLKNLNFEEWKWKETKKEVTNFIYDIYKILK